MNDRASKINDNILNLYESEENIYSSIDKTAEEAVNFPIEFLNSLNPPGMPNHILKLTIAAPIMLMRNLNSLKLCNGTRLQVISLKQNIIEAKIITGCGTGILFLYPIYQLFELIMNFNLNKFNFQFEHVLQSQSTSLKATL